MTYRWWDGPILALDYESTGPDPMSAVPVSVAFGRVEPNGTMSDKYCTLINPEQPIPAEATAVHGITDAMAAKGVSRRDAAYTIASVLADNVQREQPLPLVIYQACYDWPILLLEAERTGVDYKNGQPIVDPLLLDRCIDKWRKGSRKLDAVAARWGVSFARGEGEACPTCGHRWIHSAEADVIGAVGIARAIARAWGPTPGNSETAYFRQADLYFPGFHRLQRAMYATWRDGFNDYCRRQGRDVREEGEWPVGRLALDPARGYGPQEPATHGRVLTEATPSQGSLL